MVEIGDFDTKKQGGKHGNGHNSMNSIRIITIFCGYLIEYIRMFKNATEKNSLIY